MINRILSAVALAIVASSSYAAQWTSFKVGKLNSAATYSNNVFTVRSDGRFLYAEGHEIFSQNTFGAATKTKVNRGTLAFDPSFIAVRNLTTALMGIGGFSASGVHLFNPATPATAISSTALGTLQNYTAVWWQHPTSGRSGWIIAGGNGTGGKNNLSFLSADGTKTGALTDVLSDYSAGLATDATGNVFVALSEDFTTPFAPDSETVLKYTAAQIDTAIAAVISGTPAPLAKSASSTVFTFASAATIAVDGFGRIWAAGYLSSDLQVFDPVTGKNYHVTPMHPALAGAGGAPTYQVATFTRNGAHYVAFLANDSFFTKNSDIAYGTALAEDLPVRQVSFATTMQSLPESAGNAMITVNIDPPPRKKVTVPITISGTATLGVDALQGATQITFQANQIFGQINVAILNDGIDEVDNNETLILKLGTASPATHAASSSGTHTITIVDDDVRPLFDPVQTFGRGRVGSDYHYQIATVAGASAQPVTFKATGLPTGMTIDKNTGMISGRATVPGEYDQIVITATNSAGVSVSRGYVITVDDYAAAAHGNFVGLMEGPLVPASIGGRIDLSTTAIATVTGKLTLGKASFPFSGKLDTSAANPTGTATYVVAPVLHTLTFTIDANTGAITGSLDAIQNFDAWRTVSGTLLVGLHTFGLTIAGGTTPATPEGTGFGSATITSNGKATLTGKAADGSAFTSSAQLGVSGELPLYQPLYAVMGGLRGKVVIGSDSEHTVTGSVNWDKPTQTTPTAQPYIGGWANPLALTVAGGKYRSVSGTTAALGMVEGSGYDAALTFSGGGIEGLAAVLSVNSFIRPPAFVTIAAPQKLTVTNSTAAFGGTYVFTTHSVTFQGLLVPNTGTPDPFDTKGAGYFLLGTRTGAVALNAIP